MKPKLLIFLSLTTCGLIIAVSVEILKNTHHRETIRSMRESACERLESTVEKIKIAKIVVESIREQEVLDHDVTNRKINPTMTPRDLSRYAIGRYDGTIAIYTLLRQDYNPEFTCTTDGRRIELPEFTPYRQAK